MEEHLKFYKFSKNINSAIYLGKKDNEDHIAMIKLLPLKEKIPIKNMVQTFENTRFKKYDGTIEHKIELTTIYPALKEDMVKLVTTDRKRIIETPEMYYKDIYPMIVKQDLTWVQNILTGKTEQDCILYKDEQFVLLPDLKWNKKEMDNLYCLAIVQDSSIRSIRDLTKEHIPLLENIYNSSIKTIKEKYGVGENELRAYLHYHPSFWHLHVHFNLIKNRLTNAIVDFTVSLVDVINNIKIVSDYYQKVNLEVIQ